MPETLSNNLLLIIDKDKDKINFKNLKKDIDQIKTKCSPRGSPKLSKNSDFEKKRVKSMENFMKFQWSWSI